MGRNQLGPKHGVLLGALAAGLMLTPEAKADDVCYRLTSYFFRAPTTSTVARCLVDSLKSWEAAALCAVHSNCCLPGCELDPICYFDEVIVTDDGTTDCTFDYEGALRYFLLGGLYLNTDVVESLMVGTVGQTLPPAWIDFLVALSNSDHMRDIDWLTPGELENVYIVDKDKPSSVLAGIVKGVGSRYGVAFNNHVFLVPSVFNYIMNNDPPPVAELCGKTQSDSEFSIVSLLVHELTHVKQYHELTPQVFYAKYVYHEGSWAEGSNPLEDEAVHVEELVMDRLSGCEGSQGANLVAAGHALSAWQWLHVNDRAKLRSISYESCGGDLNVIFDCYAPISSGNWLGVGGRAEVGNVFSAGPVQLRSACKVDGDVTSASGVDLQQDARVDGTIYSYAPIMYEDDFRYFSPAFPSPGTTTVWVGNAEPLSLSPGNYGALVVNSGGTVQLTPGNYYFQFLQTEPNSKLVIDSSAGPTRLFVASSLMHKGRIVADASSTFLAYMGQWDVHLEGELNGTLVAPNAFVNVQSRNVGFGQISHSGAIYARRIELHQDTNFQHRYFPYTWEP